MNEYITGMDMLKYTQLIQ